MAEPQPSGQRPPEEPIRTLLVDDSARWLTSLETFLETQPWIEVVGTARDGSPALGLIETLRPELIILDVRMPGMNGFEVAPLIRERFPEVRILMSSGDPALRDACLACGAHGFVAKGATECELVPEILRLFSRPQHNP